MRYVDGIRTTKPYSVIGLGTWQFGSREWGYGGGYDDAASAASKKSKSAFSKAGSEIADGRKAVANALDGLKAAGYDVAS